MEGMLPVVSNSSRIATPVNAGELDVITMLSGLENPVESTWYFKMVAGAMRTTINGSRGTIGLAVRSILVLLIPWGRNLIVKEQ